MSDSRKGKRSYLQLRHDLHRHPETGLDETRTSNIVASKLKALGYIVHQGRAKTDVTGTLKSGNGKRVLGLRADMDTLPMTEESRKPWSSKVAGKFHGCGGAFGVAISASVYSAFLPHGGATAATTGAGQRDILPSVTARYYPDGT